MNEEDLPSGPPSEMVKFGVLAVILIGTVLVIALLRPLIFGRIVPAVMGEGRVIPPTAVPMVQTPGVTPSPDMGILPVEVTPPGLTPTPDANILPVEVTPPMLDTPSAGNGEIHHIVKQWETLTSIAKQYNVTVEAIVRANHITNPNYIDIGAELIIPQP